MSDNEDTSRQKVWESITSILETREYVLKNLSSEVINKAFELLKAKEGIDRVAIDQAEKMMKSSEAVASIIRHIEGKRRLQESKDQHQLLMWIGALGGVVVFGSVISTATVLLSTAGCS